MFQDRTKKQIGKRCSKRRVNENVIRMTSWSQWQRTIKRSSTTTRLNDDSAASLRDIILRWKISVDVGWLVPDTNSYRSTLRSFASIRHSAAPPVSFHSSNSSIIPSMLSPYLWLTQSSSSSRARRIWLAESTRHCDVNAMSDRNNSLTALHATGPPSVTYDPSGSMVRLPTQSGRWVCSVLPCEDWKSPIANRQSLSSRRV